MSVITLAEVSRNRTTIFDESNVLRLPSIIKLNDNQSTVAGLFC